MSIKNLQNTTIISLGGSLIVPKEGIDVEFLKKFHKLILSQVERGKKFFIIAGGGKTSANYINAINEIAQPSNDELDWLGIYATHINALFVKTMFGEAAYDQIIRNPHELVQTDKSIIIGGGYTPGNSSDLVAAIIAEKYSIKTIINLSNIDYVYDRDPNKYSDAKKITEINWSDFRKIVGSEWSPRLSTPFDPIASRECASLGAKVIIMNGKNIENLEKCLDGENFEGTIVQK